MLLTNAEAETSQYNSNIDDSQLLTTKKQKSPVSITTIWHQAPRKPNAEEQAISKYALEMQLQC